MMETDAFVALRDQDDSDVEIVSVKKPKQADKDSTTGCRLILIFTGLCAYDIVFVVMCAVCLCFNCLCMCFCVCVMCVCICAGYSASLKNWKRLGKLMRLFLGLEGSGKMTFLAMVLESLGI